MTTTDDILRAIAEPKRRAILQLVATDEMTAGDIAARFAVTRPAISQHLTVLKEVGLLSERRDGARRLYRARPEDLAELRAFLEAMWPATLERFKVAAEAGEGKRRGIAPRGISRERQVPAGSDQAPERRSRERSASMSHFVYKLIPPRSTFPLDMSEAEGAIMDAHFRYWAGLLAERKAVAYGPVMDPAGTYGLAVVEVVDEASARGIATDDPAVKSAAGFVFELHPMGDSIVRP